MNSVPESAWTLPAWTGTAAGLPAAAGDPDPVAALPADALLHLAFLERAAATPEAVAVIAADRTLTYAELAEESALLAALLAARGTARESLVAVVMEKGWEQVVACLGTLRAGAAYVPVDPHWPARRLADVLGSAGITEALTQPGLADAVDWPEGVAVTVVAPPAAEAPARPAPGAPAVDTAPGDLAYVIYTSGSTGVPKGVMIEHGPAVNTVRDVNRELGCTASDRVLALSALNFDLSVYDIFGPLSAGGAVVLPAPDDTREPDAWLRLMTEAGVTVWNSVPALMAMLTEYAAAAPTVPLPPLRAVLMSGDWIPVGLPGEVRKLFPDARQWSLGGATEASIWSIWHRISPADAESPSIPYGRSMSGQHVYVGDRLMRPRPCWVPGEIYIAGVGLARGYLGDAERTAHSFVTDPATGARRYRTGDWGRLLPSGEVEFLGREDMQVKVGGHRIELGDVEAALLACPGIRGAVAGVQGGRHRTRLTAQVLLEPGAGHSAEDVKTLLAERLPAYMVPTAVAVRDEFPLTPNGKVDRKALAALADDLAAAHPVEHPADAEEEFLLALWRGFFAERCPGTGPGAGAVAAEGQPEPGPADLSVTDNFFELGGDSLRAVRLMSVLRRETGVELPVSALFGAPTVRALARRLREARKSARDDLGRRVVVPVRTTGDAVPLVFAHPVGGDVLCYSELAGALGEDQPFYALQSPCHDGTTPSFADLVGRYAQAVLDEVPGRRYRLGGWSMGGVLALELARELTARGCTVDLVTAVDVLETPQELARAEISRDRLLGRLARDLAGLTGGSWTEPSEPFESLEELYEAVRVAGILPTDIAFTEFAAVYERFEANARALCGYRPGGPLAAGTAVHFLQAEAGGGPAAAEGWRPLCAGGFTHTEVPGDHYTVLRGAGAETVAAHLSTLLTAAAT
ncbi:amino acid adenylation domain-containing protein [Streptomyces sp. NPDC059011]|uniref:amino acid adenylation domain-containing protein n=1 Tax=unclassified Streptomyces TaxID=2593676 RepID=UPI0036BEF162